MKLGLSQKMILAVSLLVIIVSVSLTSVASNLFAKLQYQQVTRSMEKTRDDATKIIEVTVSGYMKEVAAIAQRKEIISMDWNEQNSILTSEARRIGFESFQVGDATGEVISTSGDRYSAGGETYYSNTLRGKSTISDLMYSSRYNKMVVNINCPIKRNGETVGVLSGVADASFMNSILENVKLDY